MNKKTLTHLAWHTSEQINEHYRRKQPVPEELVDRWKKIEDDLYYRSPEDWHKVWGTIIPLAVTLRGKRKW
jgi:DNA-binding ferritin-like protein (Dps family)